MPKQQYSLEEIGKDFNNIKNQLIHVASSFLVSATNNPEYNGTAGVTKFLKDGHFEKVHRLATLLKDGVLSSGIALASNGYIEVSGAEQARNLEEKASAFKSVLEAVIDNKNSKFINWPAPTPIKELESKKNYYKILKKLSTNESVASILINVFGNNNNTAEDIQLIDKLNTVTNELMKTKQNTSFDHYEKMIAQKTDPVLTQFEQKYPQILQLQKEVAEQENLSKNDKIYARITASIMHFKDTLQESNNWSAILQFGEVILLSRYYDQAKELLDKAKRKENDAKGSQKKTVRENAPEKIAVSPVPVINADNGSAHHKNGNNKIVPFSGEIDPKHWHEAAKTMNQHPDLKKHQLKEDDRIIFLQESISQTLKKIDQNSPWQNDLAEKLFSNKNIHLLNEALITKVELHDTKNTEGGSIGIASRILNRNYRNLLSAPHLNEPNPALEVLTAISEFQKQIRAGIRTDNLAERIKETPMLDSVKKEYANSLNNLTEQQLDHNLKLFEHLKNNSHGAVLTIFAFGSAEQQAKAAEHIVQRSMENKDVGNTTIPDIAKDIYRVKNSLAVM